MAWWDPAYSGRINIRIPAAPGGYASGALIRVAFETHTLIDTGQMRADRKDLRIIHSVNDGPTPVEIDRVLTNTATICFRTQAPIAPSTENLDYWLYHGNPSALAPPENRATVFLTSIQPGVNSTGLTIAGANSNVSRARPRFLKLGAPVITPGTNQAQDAGGCRDITGFNYINGQWHLWYDWTRPLSWWVTGLARGSSLISLSKVGQQTWASGSGRATSDPNGSAPPGQATLPGGIPTGTESTATSFFYGGYNLVGGQMKHWGTYLATPSTGAVSVYPYWAIGLTADDPAGPWTKTGMIFDPTGFDPQFGQSGAVPIYTFDGGVTWEALALGHAPKRWLSSNPIGPFGNFAAGQSIGGGGFENIVLYHDPTQPGGERFYFAGNLWEGGPAPTFTAGLYDTTNRASANGSSLCIFIEPTWGFWDNAWVGLPSVGVNKDGMYYVAYDGVNTQANSGVYYNHSIGVTESEWPLPYFNALSLDSLATTLATNAPVLVGDGVLRMYCANKHLGGVDQEQFRITLRNAASTHTYISAQSLADDGYGGTMRQDNAWADGIGLSGPMRAANGGTVNGNGPFFGDPPWSKTWEFERAGTRLSCRISGVEVWATETATTDPLYLEVLGGLLIHDIEFEQAAGSADVVQSVLAIAGSSLDMSLVLLDGSVSLYQAAVDIVGSPIDIPLSILTGIVSLSQATRLILPGPLRIWDGTQFVDAPLKLFDGSNLS